MDATTSGVAVLELPCHTYQERSQPYIYNDGRRCGKSAGGDSSAMCNGSSVDGSLRLGLNEMQARCTADVRCEGYGLDVRHKVFRPVSVWEEGARFSARPKWRVYEKACHPKPVLKSAQELAARFPPPPWPALIISGSTERFVRAKVVVESVGFAAVQSPAFYPPGENTSSSAWRDAAGRPCTQTGNNGVRAAHRKAWQLIQITNRSMAVFEDDVVLMTGLVTGLPVSSYDVGAFLATAALGRYDMAFLNEVCPNNNAPYLSNAAQWITPRAAHQFLKKTASCFPNRGEMQDIDHWTSKACFSRLRCLEAPPITGKTGFGCGLFAQDRLNVEPWRGFKYGQHRK